jgi:hypothetical protein
MPAPDAGDQVRHDRAGPVACATAQVADGPTHERNKKESSLMTTTQIHPQFDKTTCDQCGLERQGSASFPLMVEVWVQTPFGEVRGEFHSSQCAQQFVTRAINNAFNQFDVRWANVQSESELRLLDDNR